MTYKAHPLRVQRKRTKGYRMPESACYVGRPTKYGNPFIADHDSSGWFVRSFDSLVSIHNYDSQFEAKSGAVRLYEAYLCNDGSQAGAIRDAGRIFLVQLAKSELRGKQLACFCPLHLPCHADVLARIANE